MKKIKILLISMLLLIIPLVGLGASFTKTKTYDISPKLGYKIIDVIVNGVSKGYITSYTFSSMVGPQNIKVVTEKIPETWNEPLLGKGMTPVNWSGTEWVETTKAKWDYNYYFANAGHGTIGGDGSGKWANAKTADGSMYVWIPRYTYKIESGNHQDVDSWSSVDTPGTGKISVKFSNGIVDDTSSSYKKHPAFTFGTDELTGIWVAKYEASRSNATATSGGTNSATYNIPTSKPGVKSWTGISVSKMYDYAYDLNRDLDSHLMKNSEWGAVAYLTNAIGKIPYINNYKASSSPYVVTGYAGASQNQASVTGNANSYLWNTENGVKGSTTHNVYGIYDMSGGAFEYVSAYLDNGNSSLSSYASNLVSNKGTKYVDVYPVGTSDSAEDNYAAWSNIRGDAVYETSSSGSGSKSWDGDYSLAPDSSYPVFLRGGIYGNTSSAGVFYFSSNGGNGLSSYGFRAVLTGKEEPWAGWNAPVLGTGMTPVNWDGSDWADTTEGNWDYNYEAATAGHGTVAGDGTGKWANARTADGSMYVWIPRYSYKIESGYHEDVDSWSSVDTPGTGKISVKFSKGTVDEVTEGAANASEGYIAHPAFTFGTDELEGIWVAKYEASRNDATIDSVGTGTTVTSKPGVKSWVDTSVSKMYDYAYNLNRDLDSHLMRNSEWGAVAYLTNAIGKIPYINNSSTYITGNAGGSQDAFDEAGVTNAWNTAGGVKGTTTHNVYGIYDLSGGVHEYVATYYIAGDTTYLSEDTINKTYAGSLYMNMDTKYVETYDIVYDSTKTGDALYETSTSSSGSTAWDEGYSYAPDSSYPISVRGGGCNNNTGAGVFCSFTNYGSSWPDHGFRAVLAIP